MSPFTAKKSVLFAVDVISSIASAVWRVIDEKPINTTLAHGSFSSHAIASDTSDRALLLSVRPFDDRNSSYAAKIFAISRIFAAERPSRPSVAADNSSGRIFADLSCAISSPVSLASDGDAAAFLSAVSSGAMSVSIFFTAIAAPSLERYLRSESLFDAYLPSDVTSTLKLPPVSSAIAVSTDRVSLSSHITSTGSSSAIGKRATKFVALSTQSK